MLPIPPKNKKWKVWVLAPSIQTNSDNIDYYYDFSQSIEEYKRVFTTLQLDWVWQLVTMDNYTDIINNIADEKNQASFFPIVLNLCDGDEINGSPGISIVKYLEKKNLVYTGADEYFYNITTSKIPMKQAFNLQGVSTSNWDFIITPPSGAINYFDSIGSTIIVKPAVSGGSMGIGTKNVVSNSKDLNALILNLFDGYQGWNLTADGLILEKFIPGPEYTVFIIGSYNHPETATMFTPVERVFHPSLPENEKFLSFDRLWEIYETESSMPNEESFYEYQSAPVEHIDAIKKISWDAFVACKGIGYARVDVRMDKDTGILFVLEVNAQCGLSEDENFTSIGAILKFSNVAYSHAIALILTEAIKRNNHRLLA